MPFLGLLSTFYTRPRPRHSFIRDLPTYGMAASDQKGSIEGQNWPKRIHVPKEQRAHNKWVIQLYTTYLHNNEVKLWEDTTSRYVEAMDPIPDEEDNKTLWQQYHVVDTKMTAILWWVDNNHKLRYMAEPEAFKIIRSSYKLLRTNILELVSESNTDKAVEESQEPVEEHASTEEPVQPAQTEDNWEDTITEDHPQQDSDMLGAVAEIPVDPEDTLAPHQPEAEPSVNHKVITGEDVNAITEPLLLELRSGKTVNARATNFEEMTRLLASKSSNQQTKLSKLQKEVKAQEKKITQLEENVAQAKQINNDQLLAASQKNRNHEEALAQKDAQIADLLKKLEEKDKTKAELLQKIESDQVVITELTAHVTEYTQENERLFLDNQAQEDRLNNMLKFQETEMNTVHEQMYTLQSKNEEIANLKSQLKTSQWVLKAKDQDIARLQKTKEDLLSEQANLNHEVRRVKDEMAETQSQHEAVIRNDQLELEGLREQNQKLADDNNSYQRDLQLLNEELQAATASRDRSASQHTELANKYDIACNQIEGLKTRNESNKAALQIFENNTIKHKQEVNKVKEEREDLKNRLEEEKLRYSGLEEALRLRDLQDDHQNQQQRRNTPDEEYYEDEDDEYWDENYEEYPQNPPQQRNQRFSPQIFNEYPQRENVQQWQAEPQWQQPWLNPQQWHPQVQHRHPINQVNDLYYNNLIQQQVQPQWQQQIPMQQVQQLPQQNFNVPEMHRYNYVDNIYQNQQIPHHNAVATPPAQSPQQERQGDAHQVRQVDQQQGRQAEQQVQPIRIIAETSAKELNELDPNLIFRGRENTLGVLQWFNRLELSFKPEWDDAQKLRRAIKHLENSDNFKAIKESEFTSYSFFKEFMITSYGHQKPFTLSKWSDVQRYKGTQFIKWITSPIAVTLIEKTAARWDERSLTNDELTIIMNHLSTLVPGKVFADFYNIDKSWNSQRLLARDFMQLIGMICRQEAVQDVDWVVFDNNLEPRNNTEKCKMNTLPETQNKRYNQQTSQYQRNNLNVAQITNNNRPTSPPKQPQQGDNQGRRGKWRPPKRFNRDKRYDDRPQQTSTENYRPQQQHRPPPQRGGNDAFKTSQPRQQQNQQRDNAPRQPNYYNENRRGNRGGYRGNRGGYRGGRGAYNRSNRVNAVEATSDEDYDDQPTDHGYDDEGQQQQRRNQQQNEDQQQGGSNIIRQINNVQKNSQNPPTDSKSLNVGVVSSAFGLNRR